VKKSIILFISITVISLFSFSSEIFISPSYSLTQQATSQVVNELSSGEYPFDYLGGRISYLIDTEDTGEIKYGPYVGVFYIQEFENTYLSIYNQDLKSIGISLGLNVKYTTPLFKEIFFVVNAYGGVNSPDYLKTFSTEILVQGGFSYSNIYIIAGYETRYYRLTSEIEDKYIKVNHFPISMGVSFQF
jgi:hypothetical protein